MGSPAAMTERCAPLRVFQPTVKKRAVAGAGLLGPACHVYIALLYCVCVCMCVREKEALALVAFHVSLCFGVTLYT